MFEVQSRSLKSARFWYTRRDQIDMVPEYQRVGGIWKREDQQFLIDSMLNDYDIPKLYLADFTTLKTELNEERKRYAVIDGKQRLEAIFNFFSNSLPLSNNFIYESAPELIIGGLLFKDLKVKYEDISAKIEEYPLPIMHVVTDEPGRINELFVRLNKGAALTGAERRNAMLGPIPKVIRRISEHPFFGDHIQYQTKRGQNLNAAAKLVLFELQHEPGDTKRSQLDRMVESYSGLNGQSVKTLIDEIALTLDRMCRIFGVKDILLRSQGNIPVYYWVIKNTEPDKDGHFREFLNRFITAVKRHEYEDVQFGDETIIDFEKASRSTNDAWSYNARIEILELEFRRFLE